MNLDEAEDWAWCDAQFAAIEAYVKAQNIPHGVICDWPEWYAAPYVGLWAVEDPADPGFVGHWVLAGDTTGVQPQPVKLGVEIVCALLVVALGKWLGSRRKPARAVELATDTHNPNT